MRQPLIILFCLFLLAIAYAPAKAQAVPDTTFNNAYRDTVTNSNLSAIRDSNTALPPKPAIILPYQPIPKKSGMYASILPGLGQFYNHQYWKIPFIYAGIAVSGYFLIDNTNEYHKYRRAYIKGLQGQPTGYDNIYSTADLKTLQDGFKHYLDITTLLMAVGYAVQVMDAITFAHLKNFDVSRDISFRMEPVIAPSYVGLGVVMRWK